MISEFMTMFAGRQVIWYDPERGPEVDPTEEFVRWNTRGSRSCWNRVPGTDSIPEDPTQIAYRIGSPDPEHENLWSEHFNAFLADSRVGLVEALVIGAWHYEAMNEPPGSTPIIEELVAARERFAGLKALFLGDIVYNECEISWLIQGDVVPLFDAYPNLEEFCVRGVGGLSFAGLRHPNLRRLTIQSGGLPETILRQLWEADLPNLEHLELWLGAQEYGGIETVDPLEPLLSGRVFPKLRSLGLRDSEISNAVAGAVASSPILERLDVLDLSQGNLSNSGALALVGLPSVAQLKRLDISHHFVAPSVVEQLRDVVGELVADIDHDTPEYTASEENELERYIAVTE